MKEKKECLKINLILNKYNIFIYLKELNILNCINE